jgi:hypothetical protein
MGHSSVKITERYAHLSPDLFGECDLTVFVSVDLPRDGWTGVKQVAGDDAIGYGAVTGALEETNGTIRTR